MTVLNQQLQHIISLSEQMLESAQQAAWEKLAQLEQNRIQLLETIFPINPLAADPETENLLSTLVEMNQQINLCCESEKKQLQDQLSGLNKNKKAVAAYHTN